MTIETHKTVFISYRRNVSSFIARAIYQDLRANGFDVFMDVQSIDSGEFDTIILRQIVARGHFLVICTPGTFDRCNELGDWLRREIEHALDNGRNVVPIFVNEFKFDDATKKHLTGKLVELPRRHGLNVPHDFFEEAMTRLRTRYLKQAVIGEVVATPKADESAVAEKQAEAASQPAPTDAQLTAEQYFRRGLTRRKTDYEGKIADYSEAIRLNPDYTIAYYNRANAYKGIGQYASAIADHSAAIRLDPNYSKPYNNRAVIRNLQNDFDNAIIDASRAIDLSPHNPYPYDTRAEAHEKKGDYELAIVDYERYLKLGGGQKRNRISEIEGKIRDLKRKLEKQQKS